MYKSNFPKSLSTWKKERKDNKIEQLHFYIMHGNKYLETIITKKEDGTDLLLPLGEI